MDELTIDYKKIGVRIALRRKELKMTQETLTNIVDMSINQLSNIENSHSVPTLETIIKLSHALKITPDYFLLGIIKDESQTPIEIAQRAMLCTEKQQRLNYISLKDTYLFTTQAGGTMTTIGYRRMWEKFEKAMGTKEITAHVFRHNFATILYNAGADVKAAQTMRGHNSISVTMDIYTHLGEKNRWDTANKLNDYFR